LTLLQTTWEIFFFVERKIFVDVVRRGTLILPESVNPMACPNLCLLIHVKVVYNVFPGLKFQRVALLARTEAQVIVATLKTQLFVLVRIRAKLL
jgi:hypothetical protein